MKRIFAGVALVFVLAGCSAGLNESFQAAYGLNEVTRRVTTEMNDSEKISIEQAEDALEYTDEARRQLDAAWGARETAQDSTLSVVRRITGSMRVYLNEIMEGR